MGNLVNDVTTFERKILKIEGPLGVNMTLKLGEKGIKAGQVLAYDELTGKLVKYVKDTTEAFTIALDNADATSSDCNVLVAVPGTVFNKKEIVGATLTTDFKVVKQLWGNGIILKEVE